ncbi:MULTISPECIES: ABC transporter ATP-binding protein [Bradyrhizobium]|uniref:ABC transporter ATP-binding protein n=1 Tax=Bradyrhizobium elkanii TaxID=29448 RepID=UPI001FD94EC7|nr:ABC transporter ATP-binding protein [Bradyrhizobium elkanii]
MLASDTSARATEPFQFARAAAPTTRRGASFMVDGMGFGYRPGRDIFRNVTLKARPGEFVALLGPSGCGKTTLLNLLSGFLAPHAGTVTIDGRAVRPEMSELGYVFQAPNLFPWLSVRENVRFGLRMAGQLDPDEQRRKALQYLDLVGLSDVADELPNRLSGGMQQRVALARALVLEPSLLLMDEPFAALDAITRSAMNAELLRLWSTLGQTILFITHDVEEAVFLADRVLVLGFPPHGLDSEVTIDLPRPRDLRRTRVLPGFAELCDTLLQRIAGVMQARSTPASFVEQESVQ